MIQMLTYSGNEESLRGSNVVVNKLHDAQSLDEFEINIIDLSSQRFWENKGDSTDTIDKINDFKSISAMIDNSEKADIIIIFPQNMQYTYNMRYSDKRNWQCCELKNMLERLKMILGKLYSPIKPLNIVYENTSTCIGTVNVSASFYFNGITENIFTKSIKSNKATTIGYGDVILSTLNINDYGELIAFLRTIGLIKGKQRTPEWMEEVKMFDDEKQLEIIQENEQLIMQHKKKISYAKNILSENRRYKSILYTNGDELVEVVFEILEKMLGCDLSGFQDKKKEDFCFPVGEKIFIGEIKGITPNVKKANVSQLDVHVQEYLDEHENLEDNIVSLLIINHQRNKPLQEREDVQEEQIKLAMRNGSLIVETLSLLKLFEQYLSGDKTREECIEILKNNVGLLIL